MQHYYCFWCLVYQVVICQGNIPVQRRHLPPLGIDPLAWREELWKPLATSNDNKRQLLIFWASSEAENLKMIDYIIFE